MSTLLATGFTLFPFVPPIIENLLFSHSVYDDYKKIDKPWWHPPAWLFGPAWAFLFASMGYSSFLIYRDGVGEQRDMALGLYASSLVLNQLGNPIFGDYISRGWASSFVGLLSLNVAACIWAFNPINQTAAYLMVPYLGWCSFATCLSYNIWKRNRNKKD